MTLIETLNTKDKRAFLELQIEISQPLQVSQDKRGNGCTVENGKITHLRLNNMGLEKIPESLSQFNHVKFLNLTDNLIQDFSLPKNLHTLTSLNVSKNNISKLGSLDDLTKLEELNLSSNLISDLSSIRVLSQLRKLYFSSNQVKDLTGLIELQNIQVIDGYNNSFTSLSGIENFISLSDINFGSNKLEDLSPIANLLQLHTIHLPFAEISDISPLTRLVNLSYLNLMFNNLSDINPLKKLENLKTLDLYGNSIVDVSALARHWQLEKLELSSNPIETISPLSKKIVSINLTNCTKLDWSSLSDFTELRNLVISNNKLSNIDFLANLKNLKRLELQNNQLSNVDILKNLKLSSLNLSDNQISSFPRWLLNSEMEIKGKNSYGDGYIIQPNPIEDVPNEFLKQNNNAIDDYLKSLENGAQPINEIKVIILGEGDAGKTSLVNYLEGKPYNKHQSQTHGINIAKIGEELGVTMKIWDFGGQDIMHHTHQLFLTQNSIYILVLNARQNNDTEKWLKLIKVFGGESPVIILTNKIDENPSSHENIRFLNSKYTNIQNRYVRISCETSEGLADFRTILDNTIKELLHVRTLWGNSWLAAKDELEQMRGGKIFKNYINFEAYEEICDRTGVYPSHRETLINWLHQLGVVTYFPDANLSETNVINPSWLTEAFYKIINAKIVADNFGKFEIKELSQILDAKTHPKQKYNFLLSLMTKFELCYQIDENSYLIPDLLRKEEPNLYINTRNALKFKFKYSALLPKAILPKFMVRRHLEIKDKMNWRTGMVIRDSTYNATGVVRVDEDEKEIYILVDGQEKRGYLASILSSLKAINQLYDGLEFEELVPCNCRKCKDTEKPYYFKHSFLNNLKKNNKNLVTCEYSLQDIYVNEILGILISNEELQAEISSLLGSGAYLTKNHLEKGDIISFMNTVKSLFSGVSYLLFEKSEKAYHMPLFMILRAIFGHKVKADELQSKGRLDISVNLDQHIYILELKLDGSSKEALQQIHTNQYYQPFLMEQKPIDLIGINFSSTERNVESFLYERLTLPENF